MSLGDIVVGVGVAFLGLVGLLMAARALDSEIFLFGLSLFGFAVVFVWGVVFGAKHREPSGPKGGSAHG